MSLTPSPVAALIGLLRLGEWSAQTAFARLAGALSHGEFTHVSPQLLGIAADERRHDAALTPFALVSGMPRASPSTRRFFMAMDDRNPIVHLARIASLDACVCQVINRALASSIQRSESAVFLDTLNWIRRDEARHVRIARRIALHMGATPALLTVLDHETRHAFARVLGEYAPSFSGIGVDANALQRQVCREPA